MQSFFIRWVSRQIIECRQCHTGHSVLKPEHFSVQKYIDTEYSILKKIGQRALELEGELTKGKKYPFDKIIYANIGDPQTMGQRPITFLRQVLAIMFYNKLLEVNSLPEDVRKHAKTLLEGIHGSIGSYSHPRGFYIVRKHVAQYLERRDGCPANIDDIYLCSGALYGMLTIFRLLSHKKLPKRLGIMFPNPMYPLYGSSVKEYNIEKIDYKLQEDDGVWNINIPEMKRAVTESRKNCLPCCLFVINPNNPTGLLLTENEIADIIKFAFEENLFILADETYQDNVYGDKKFVSFKKVLCKLGDPYIKTELLSFHTISKGCTGESGLRGGFSEMVNLKPETKNILNKFASVQQCPNTVGQIAVDCMINPLNMTDPSFATYKAEKETNLNIMAEKGNMIIKGLSKIPGIKCKPFVSGIYIYPTVDIPNKAIEAANASSIKPDVLYVIKLLEATGICIIPGSAFGQTPSGNSFHLRFTVLPPKNVINVMIDKFEQFHKAFLKEYS